MTRDEFNALADLLNRGTDNPDQAYVCLVFNRGSADLSIHSVWFSTDIKPEKLPSLFAELSKSSSWKLEYQELPLKRSAN